MARTGEDSGGRRGAGADAFLITRAEQSLEDQQRARVRKYLWMMSIRIPALLLASGVYAWTHNPWWAVGIIAISIPMPWMAVLIANDRPPRKRGEVQYYKFGPGRTVGPAELSTEPAPPPPRDPAAEGLVIEADPADPAARRD
ncbi:MULTISPECIES: DUF3099 domain-containing protein [unclassified Gordonia (in: high G+C Gram-positive bacteria)]|uniref:DUF3099 domain-containing protein n=1 Tax=unclassified Gordonia (in: high G+C Gram-positive bacteria) TaxID=2657482 RepID=UPI001FFE5F88|nr:MULTISPECIES: DUF3099 domain-containing protein [unclassified Gordonia (in: high G+C Gram-positive bacteria)]UQE73304.1 DUF3099 domain-containing protein [Gordonia sp. PP30]